MVVAKVNGRRLNNLTQLIVYLCLMTLNKSMA